jgi:hypothetical protein
VKEKRLLLEANKRGRRYHLMYSTVLVIRVFQKDRAWIEVLILKILFTFWAIFQFSLVILKPKSMV